MVAPVTTNKQAQDDVAYQFVKNYLLEPNKEKFGSLLSENVKKQVWDHEGIRYQNKEDYLDTLDRNFFSTIKRIRILAVDFVYGMGVGKETRAQVATLQWHDLGKGIFEYKGRDNIYLKLAEEEGQLKVISVKVYQEYLNLTFQRENWKKTYSD